MLLEHPQGERSKGRKTKYKHIPPKAPCALFSQSWLFFLLKTTPLPACQYFNPSHPVQVRCLSSVTLPKPPAQTEILFPADCLCCMLFIIIILA